MTSGLPLSAPLHVGSVGLRTRDAETLSTWYQRHMGLGELSRDGDNIQLGVDEVVLRNHRQQTDLVTASGGEAGLYHTAFLLPSRAALAQWVLTAAAEGGIMSGISPGSSNWS